jgi:outer membrane protein, multidrug efflux system
MKNLLQKKFKMKLLYNFLWALALTSILAFSGCKTIQPLENETATNIPTAYSSVSDSLNSADIKWSDYFKDSNLISLINIAITNNFDLLMATQKIEVLRSRSRLSNSDLFPSVSGVSSFAQRKYGLYTMDGAGNISTEITPGNIVPIHLNDYYLGFQASWEVDLWGKLRNKKKAARARYLSSIEGKHIVISNLIADVAYGYYELLAFDNKLDIIKETIRLQENALEIVKFQKESAAANELAVKQFEAQLLNSKALSAEVQQEIIKNENTLNFLLGRFPQPIKRTKEGFMDSVPQKLSVGIPSHLLKNRPDIRQAELELIASHADVNAAKAAFYPSLTITGGIGLQAFKPSFLFTSPESIAYAALGTLVAPLINRGAIKATFSSANANQLDALYNYQKKIIYAYVEVFNQLTGINYLDEIYELRLEQAEVLTQSIDISSELFKTGRANYLEVLMAQRGALEARIQAIEIRRKQYNARVNMYKTLGGGWR